jgi:hypothetical protein
VSKSTAFCFGLIAILIVFTVNVVNTNLNTEKISQVPAATSAEKIAAINYVYNALNYGAYITGIAGLVGGFLAIQTVNNGVKGKWWNNDLYEKENADAMRSAALKTKGQGEA